MDVIDSARSSVASIDRRVEVIDGSTEQRASIRRVSDLRPLPFVVLLGEPGIGKSTIFGVEAGHERVLVLKVRELMTGTHAVADVTLFLDALDEYRTDGQPADKVHELAHAMAAVNAPRWRLSCRSEDWRKAADIRPIQQTTAGAPIVVANILPLDHVEATAVLVALGENDPDAFMAKAEALGAGGFVGSPLSLMLLYRAVSRSGTWPSTRFDLFKSAIASLSYERNEERKRTERHAPDEIITAAAKTCLILLVSGARAIWYSNDEPPNDFNDMRAFLTAHDLQLDRTLLKDTLDTALFHGEGEAFEPMHRTVAEYLAAQALASAVIGSEGRAALPLSRAIALITGMDGCPPTELRGVYAWFAAHLAKRSDEDGAGRLIETDAVTVLVYGDAAVFATPSRRAILANLGRNDPYFRSSEVGVTAVGGLAGDDLAADFTAVLTEPSDRTHRVLTVFEVLTNGPPVVSVLPLLRSIALDPMRPEGHRWRAADAWLNGAEDSTSACRELFDALTGEPISGAREALRAHLAVTLPPSELSVADIKSVIADFNCSPEDNTIGRLGKLRRNLETEPRPELFDEPIDLWLSGQKQRQRTRLIEVEQLLDYVLAASIRGTPDLSATRLWRWTVNARGSGFSNLDSESAKAISDWLDGDSRREVALLDAILAEDDLTNGPWAIGNIYFITTRRRPSETVILHVLAKATTSATKGNKKRLLAIAVEMARHPGADIGAYWEIYHCVANQPGCKLLLKHLTKSTIEPWRRDQYRRAERLRRRDAKQKALNIKALAPVIAELRVGGKPQHLKWAADLYFHSAGSRDEPSTGIGRIIYFTDKIIADAILAGWEYLTTKNLIGIDAARLGKAEAENQTYYVESAAIAGLDHLFEENRLPDPISTPIAVAIAVLKSSWIISDQTRRGRLEKWAVDRLNLEPAVGAVQLLEFWGAALDAGATELSSLSRLTEDCVPDGATARALDTLLNTRRSIPLKALRSAVSAAVKILGSARLLALAEAALADTVVAGEQRTIWSFVAFALDPASHGDRFVLDHSGKEEEVGELFYETLSHGVIESFGGLEGSTRASREAVMVHFLGRVCSPEGRWPHNSDTNIGRLSYAVSCAINWLAAQSDPDAGAALAKLVEDSNLTAWLPTLHHAQAQHLRLRRDRFFKYPAPAAVRDAIDGGPPVNASDLRAIVMEELERLRAELRTNTTPWKSYWNVDSAGKVIAPRIENQCRNHLLDRLQDKLKPYHITAALPEVPRSEETRADMLILTGVGRNLPVEAKRHYHPDIWVAASTQLQGYAADEGADGFGIYLVFWFGNEQHPTPARPNGENGPTTAAELESMLKADLSADLRARTDVIVFDVSDPKAPAIGKPRKKRTPKR